MDWTAEVGSSNGCLGAIARALDEEKPDERRAATSSTRARRQRRAPSTASLSRPALPGAAYHQALPRWDATAGAAPTRTRASLPLHPPLCPRLITLRLGTDPLPLHSPTHSKKNQATTQKTKRYRRDIDQIHEDVKDGGKRKFLEDLAKKDLEDLPGAP